ncbi:recombination regulator RecX [Pusillimonas sp. CC-YST705]|uniref:Regulatory protein RecX n=1 Tax=Mesopusillimonas faecipullorum TaxID=2755040 RepID=A0ABS8CBD9_9BURK|nr:recombination regulator RecX [Mesopusillimonas faecipullorum]MCB5363345.1 recombination regulator RecX [Mesopusillimonas faecipullorum]
MTRNKAFPPDDFETLASPDDAGTPGKQRAPTGISLKARAVNYLARREHSRQELARKLAPHVPPDEPEVLQALLDELERENWLSNQRFAQGMAHRRGVGRGTALVMQELRQHGLEAADLEVIRDQLRDTEFERAQEAWQKKFAQAPEDAKSYAKQARFMASRGFSNETFRRVLSEHSQTQE